MLFHNKGIDMIDLPNTRRVRHTIPDFLDASLPPIIGYTYRRTISGKTFIQKRVAGELDYDVGNATVVHSIFAHVGHVVTGDLSFITDVKIRRFIAKGCSYREESNVNWYLNAKIRKEAVSKYKVKWSKKEGVDREYSMRGKIRCMNALYIACDLE